MMHLLNPLQRVNWNPNAPCGRSTNVVAWIVFCLLLGGVVRARTLSAAEATSGPSDQAIAFTVKILPLLQSRCFGCHGEGDEIEGGLDMTSLQELSAGGESGEPAIVPGNPQSGTLLGAVTWEEREMPPKESERLTRAEVDAIKEWISAGAPWPSAAEREAIRLSEQDRAIENGFMKVATSGGTTPEWTSRRYKEEDIWAFQPLQSGGSKFSVNAKPGDAVDFYIDRELAVAGIDANPPASPRDLIRRLSYTLTGLPPTPAEIEEFLSKAANDSDSAYEEFVDRFLANPRYGEHWARHWLDVTRYADTGGMSNDYERSNMWRYRDYVIRAFNSDKPYNEFVIEQLAGDELTDQSVRSRFKQNGLEGAELEAAVSGLEKSGEYSEQEAEWLVATGFLRMGPWDNAMVEPAEARQIYLDDLVNITGQAFLSQTLRCCKCHDHKFDPLPTRDYYRIYSAFSTTFPAERAARFIQTENQERFEAGKQFVEQMLAFARERKQVLVDKQEAAARLWYGEHELPYKSEKDRRNDPDELKPPRHVGLTTVDKGRLKVREQDEWIWARRLERYEPLVQSVFSAPTIPTKATGARKLRIFRNPAGKGKKVEARILAGGSLAAAGDIVQPGVLSAVSHAVNAVKDDPYLIPNNHCGRRLHLAKWIASESNPLTARSIVNRIWQFHFGKGIAANTNNFGGKGGKPTHPELLDHLANNLIEHGWSLKAIHREILLSRAYRRSVGTPNTKALEVDPENRLLARFMRRRLTAEEIRDSLLQITGELVHSTGGLPVFPEINMEVALQPRMIQFSLAPAYQPSSTPSERNRRSIYAYQCRGQADPFMELFNQPNPNESCELRDTASLTPQALTLLNSDFMLARAAALAATISVSEVPLESLVDAAFSAVLGRNATAVERTRLAAFCKQAGANADLPVASPYYPTEITRTLVEEFSGEPFEYTEILPVFSHYEPDRSIADLPQRRQTVANICLLLMNTNEFLFVN